MLTRVYIDNFRCLVNFEFKPESSKQLILGINGSGKSVFLAALRAIRDFAVVGYKTDRVFTAESRTRWQTLTRQSFELEVTGNGGRYLYTLWIDVEDDRNRSRVIKEALDFDEKPLFLLIEDQVRLYDDDHVQKANYPFDADRSGLAILGPRKASTKLAWFKDWLNKLYCFRIDPLQMKTERKDEDDYPEDDLGNFAAWYGHIVQEQTGTVLRLQQSLRDVLDGFDSLELRRTGRTAKGLRAVFTRPSNGDRGASKNQPFEFDFDELSDGQRVLIALYTILYCVVEPDATVCIDEPENYIALAEIQPWLFELGDRIEEVGAQVILISHHPELIDLLAVEHGTMFSRIDSGPVRIEPYRPDALSRLAPSERIARGWERG